MRRGGEKYDQLQFCKTSGNYLVLPPEALTGIIVGAKGDLASLQHFVSEHTPDLKVQQATIAEEEFKINISPDYWP